MSHIGIRKTVRENEEVREKKEDDMSTLNMDFTSSELKIASQGSWIYCTRKAPAMFWRLPAESLKLVLRLFNKIWREGVLPSCWKRAIILPFNKPGKDNANPGSYSLL